ncbi:MAG: HD family phosphohydrolase, partial [Dehalococcoidia bacterium]
LIDALNSKGATLTLDERTAIANFTSDEWRRTSDEATRLLGTVLEEPFTASELPSHLASLPNRVSAGITAMQGEVAAAIVSGLVVPTENVDAAATQRQRDLAAAGVPAQRQTYARDQVIVREGDVIDGAKLEALQNAGLLTFRLRYADLGAVVLLALVVACALALFLVTFHQDVLATASRSLLLALLVAVIVLLAKIYMPIVLPDTKHQFLPFAFPAALVPMLVTSLFDADLAVAVAGIVSLLVTFTALYLPELSGIVGLTALQPLEMSAAFFISGLVGVLVVNRAERFNRFVGASLAVAAATSVVLLSFWLLEPMHTLRDVGWLLLAGGVNGIVSALLTVGTFVLLGAVFNISTRLQLMELAQLNQPLLRRLQDEAPGTFHHSILVGNLGERAADLIGADALLVRVGCYYHDIGKLSRPGMFIENQLGGDNLHDTLSPVESNRIIQEHVRYGAELGRKYHLPERVRAFTTEHHGTRLVAFFYRKAAQTDPDVDPGIFTYPGPRPQSKETAIAMLADSTEAVVRASRDHSAEKMAELVEGVIAERLAEGQFDDCELTLRDLRTIADSFRATLRAIYHPRIEYPEPTEAERRRRGGASRRRELPEPVEAPGARFLPAPTVAEAPAAPVVTAVDADTDGANKLQPVESAPSDAGESMAPSTESADPAAHEPIDLEASDPGTTPSEPEPAGAGRRREP